MKNKVIITCAITGGVHTPTMSKALPITPEQIATQAVEAAEAGASILHLHARDPKDGRPTPSAEVFMEFLPRIKESTDAVINITTGGGVGMTLDDRLAAARRAKPELCSLNMGSMNFGIYPMAKMFDNWEHDWEPKLLESSRDYIFRNTFSDIESILREVGDGYGTRFEFECYDVGHLYALHHFLERRLVKPPLFIQTVYGILGGIGATAEHLLHMKRTADSLFGNDYVWSVLAAGKSQMPLATMGALMGSNVRVGLEDSLYISRGKLAENNAEQVGKIKRILAEFSLDIATPDEARQLLNLKGGDAVAF